VLEPEQVNEILWGEGWKVLPGETVELSPEVGLENGQQSVNLETLEQI